MKRLLPDILCLAGAGLLLYGLYEVYYPLAFAVGGLLSIAAGVYTSRRMSK